MKKQSVEIGPPHGKEPAIRKSVYTNMFTLVELLVVIAIIGVLASMLLPALKSARDTAKGINCLGNLKQLGYASEMYMNDYAYFVPYRNVGATTDYWFGPIGRGFLDPYFPGNTKNLGYWSTDPSKHSTLACPSEDVSSGGASGTATIGQNAWLSSDTVFTRQAAMTLPSRLFTFADSMAVATIDGQGDFKYRHKYGVNVVYADSHADFRKIGSFTVNTSNPFRTAFGKEDKPDN